MSEITSTGGILSIETLAAAHATAKTVLPHWMLGDDTTAMRRLCDDLEFDLMVLRREAGRDDLGRMASDRVRRISQRYRRDVAHGGIAVVCVDDALRDPESYGRSEPMALAA